MRFFIPILAAAIAILSVVSAVPAPPSPGTDNSALQDGTAKPGAAQRAPAKIGQGLNPEYRKILNSLVGSRVRKVPPGGVRDATRKLVKPGATDTTPGPGTAPDSNM